MAANTSVCLLDTAAFKSVNLFTAPCEHFNMAIRECLYICAQTCASITTPQQTKPFERSETPLEPALETQRVSA